MKLPRIVLVSLVLALPVAVAGPAAGAPSTPPEYAARGVAAAQALIARVLPSQARLFECARIAQESGRDVFEYEAGPDGRVVLRGNDCVALAVAFNQYLRREAHVNYDWQAVAPLVVDGPLPMPKARVRGSCAAAERFFLNYCTYGYTMPWWHWAEWQRFIDWMAMNGINRPLLQCGQEAVWYQVWQDYGVKPDDIRAFFSGAAHLPWHRMANLDRWGGPLPLSYIDGQRALQVQILGRVRELGMKAILSGFAGHVPPQLAASHPSAKISRIGAGWGGLAPEYATHYLDPTDPLFAEIQRKFIAAQTALFGTDHLYAADPFNEMTPPSLEPAYLAAVSRAIFAGMTAVDPDARWYEMAWTFYYQKKLWNVNGRLQASLTAVPPGRLVLLDYVCEQEEFYRATDRFYGQPFIWNYLGNFGGNTHLVAPLHKVSARLGEALHVPNCVGVGSTLEGINVNPVIYDLVLEQPWHANGTVDVAQWIDDYATQRAGGADPAVTDAWRRLATDVLVDEAKPTGRHGSIFQVRPPAHGPALAALNDRQIQVDYPPAALVAAVKRLLEASPSSARADGYRFDVVNLTRQALVNRGGELYAELTRAYVQKDRAGFDRAAAAFLELGRDLDRLLATRHEFLLGRWIAASRAWGVNAAEADAYEHNAREIITTWHVPGGKLEDYANRQYAGLMRDYYLPRWEKFFALGSTALQQGTAFPEKEFAAWTNATSAHWIDEHGNGYATQPTGDPVGTARELFAKYFAAR